MSNWAKFVLFFFVILVTRVAGAVCSISMNISENQNIHTGYLFENATLHDYYAGEQVRASRTDTELAIHHILIQDDADLPPGLAIQNGSYSKDLKSVLKHILLLSAHRSAIKDRQGTYLQTHPNPLIHTPVNYYIYTLERILI